MEHKTEFSLEKNLENWKSELSKSSNITIDNIYELESHLHDEINELKQLGLNYEESLLIAKKRIGTITELRTEFSKVNKKKAFINKTSPYLKGILMFKSYYLITYLLANILLIVSNYYGMDNNDLNYISIVVLILSSSLLSIVTYKKYRNKNLKLQKLTSFPFLISVIIISKLLNFFCVRFITQSGLVGISNYTYSQITLSIYYQILVLFILVLSSIFFFKSKRDNKFKLSH